MLRCWEDGGSGVYDVQVGEIRGDERDRKGKDDVRETDGVEELVDTGAVFLNGNVCSSKVTWRETYILSEGRCRQRQSL